MEEPGHLRRAAVDAVAGAVAGAVSRTVTSPLDVIKIRFQVQIEPTSTRLWGNGVSNSVSKYTSILQATRDILQEEGILGFWRGNVPALLMVMPYTAIQFVVLQKLKSFAAGSSRRDKHIQLNSALSFVSGSLAGCAATVGSYPFDLLRTILASQGEPKVYPNLRSAFMGILRSRGFQGLYTGLTPTLVEIIPYAGIQFGSYDVFKRWTLIGNQKRSTQYSSSFQHFICGLAAGTLAKVCCHPLDVIKKRFQVEGLQRHPRYGARVEEKAYKNMWNAIKIILENEGSMGFYKGLFPSVVKAAPAAAVTFVVYELVSDRLQSVII